MHWAVYKSVWFKLGMLIGTTELYILILIFVTLSLTRITVRCKSKIVCAIYLSKFLMDLDGICYAVEICLSDEPHTHFYCERSIFKRENPTGKKKKTTWLAFEHVHSNLVWWEIPSHCTAWYHLGYTDLHFHSISQLQERNPKFDSFSLRSISRFSMSVNKPTGHGWNLVCCHDLLACSRSC